MGLPQGHRRGRRRHGRGMRPLELERNTLDGSRFSDYSFRMSAVDIDPRCEQCQQGNHAACPCVAGEIHEGDCCGCWDESHFDE